MVTVLLSSKGKWYNAKLQTVEYRCGLRKIAETVQYLYSIQNKTTTQNQSLTLTLNLTQNADPDHKPNANNIPHLWKGLIKCQPHSLKDRTARLFIYSK